MTTTVLDPSTLIAHYDPANAKPCHCGSSDRAFINADFGMPEHGKATLHIVVQESDGAKAHYHKELVEYYVILEHTGDVGIELNDIVYAVKKWTRIAIPPGVKHRIRGICTFLVVVNPGHRTDDDHFGVQP